MKKTFCLLPFIAIILTGCYNPAVDTQTRFAVDNQTENSIGMVSIAFPYGKAKLKVKPMNTDSIEVRVTASSIDMCDFELCNLTDTSALFLTAQEFNRIYFNREINTEWDEIISRHIKLIIGKGHYWTVTDELLTLMKKDPTLVERYPEFY